MKRIARILPAIALLASNLCLVLIANSTSSVWGYQPKEPDLKNYKR